MKSAGRQGFLAGLVMAATSLSPVFAADFMFENLDGTGEGLNDETAVSPVGGNPGVTLGEQRLLVLGVEGHGPEPATELTLWVTDSTEDGTTRLRRFPPATGRTGEAKPR